MIFLVNYCYYCSRVYRNHDMKLKHARLHPILQFVEELIF